MAKQNTGSRLFTWLLALLIPLLLVCTVLVQPVEEHAEDMAYLHVYRAVVFSAARADGWLYPRWASQLNGGLGSPLFSFYSPGLYEAMNALHALGLPHTIAWRVVAAIALVVGAVGAFALGMALWGRADIALLGATSFVYAPYLQQDLLQRGSPESLAILLGPCVLLTFLRLAECPSGWRLALAVGSWALLILTHNLSALLFVLPLGAFIIYLACRYGTRALRYLLPALLLGAMLAAVHIGPFILERSYVQFQNVLKAGWARAAEQPLALGEFITLPLVFDSGLANNAMFSARLGVQQVAPLAAGLAALPFLWHKKCRLELGLLGGALLLALGMIWLQTSLADWLWHAVKPLELVQFRWRFLGLVALPAGGVLSYLVGLVAGRWRGWAVGLGCMALVGVQIPSLYPQLLPLANHLSPDLTAAQVTQIALEHNQPDLTSMGDFVPRWREWPFSAEETKWVGLTPIANLPEGARLISDERKTGWIRARFQTPLPFACSMHLLYYPGWMAYVDGVRQAPRPSTGGGGYATVDVGAGEHTVELRYEGTLVQHVSGGISLLTLGILLALALLWRVPGAAGASKPLYLAPAWWVPATMVAFVALKVAWIDPHTSLFRLHSTPEAIVGAQVQTDVRFGDTIRLCGYTLAHSAVRPGGTVRITLFWERLRPLDDPHVNSFVHLLGNAYNAGAGSYLWGQQDKQELPETWEEGKLYRDVYEFSTLPEAPTGQYKLEIGWWQPATGKNLPPRIVVRNEHLSASEAGFVVLEGLELP